MCHPVKPKLVEQYESVPRISAKNNWFPLLCSLLVCLWASQEAYNEDEGKGKTDIFQRKPSLNSLKREHVCSVCLFYALPFLHVCVTTWKVCNVSRATFGLDWNPCFYRSLLLCGLTCTQVPRFQQRRGGGKESSKQETPRHTVFVFIQLIRGAT